MLRIFKRKHKHKWTEEQRVNERYQLVYFTRECSCGAKQIQHNGPSGDGKWHQSGKFKFDWEKEWFENSVPYLRGN